MGKRINLFASAEQELEWYFSQADAAIGVHAQVLGVSGTATAEERANAKHIALRRWEHHEALVRRAKVEWILAQVAVATRRTLALGYTPRRYAWPDELAELRVRSAFRRAGSNASLITLALEGEAVVTAMRKFAPDRAPTFDGRLEFLAWECKQGRKKVYEPIRLDADRVLTDALAEFDPLLVQWARDRERAREAAAQAALAAHARVMAAHD